MAEIKTTELPQVTSLSSRDDIIVNAGGRTKRISYADFSGNSSEWTQITGKPFDKIDTDYFTLTPAEDSAVLLSFNKDILDSIDWQDAFSEIKQELNEKIDENTNNISQLMNYTGCPNAPFNNNLIWNLLMALGSYCGATRVENSNTWNYGGNGGLMAKGNNGTNQYLSLTFTGIMGTGSSHGFGLKYNTYSSENYTYPYYTVDIIGDWESGKEYKAGYFVVYNARLYKCTVDNSDTEFTASKWQLIIGGTSSGTGGMDFDALSTAITSGTQKGITVTANSDSQTIDFEVTSAAEDPVTQDEIFDILSSAITQGTQTGITVTADKNSKKIDFDVSFENTVSKDEFNELKNVVMSANSALESVLNGEVN